MLTHMMLYMLTDQYHANLVCYYGNGNVVDYI